MAFRFSLETVLRLKQVAEEREERAMEEILRKIAREQQELGDLAAARKRLSEQCEAALRSKTSGAELLFVRGQIRALEGRESNARENLAHLVEQRQAQMKVYETAHRNRELLSRMREEQIEYFRRKQALKEQMQMDDIFSCRRTQSEK